MDARDCLQTVRGIVRGGLGGGAVAVEPGGRGDAERVVGGLHQPAGARSFTIWPSTAVSWRILLEDLNIAWAQHRGGQQVVLPAPGTSFARWASLLAEHARKPEVVEQATAWRQVAAMPAALPAVRPEMDTYRHRRELGGVSWMSRRPGCCSARCRRRFTPGSTTSC